MTINSLMAAIGLFACTYFLLSDRYNTKSKETIIQLSLWITIWIFLVSASLPTSDFEPTVSTTIARLIVLILNMWQFKSLIRTRCRKQTAFFSRAKTGGKNEQIYRADSKRS